MAAASPPAKPVRLGFVGGGYMGQLAHIENYWKLPGVELAALAEGRPKTAELVARTYGIARTYPHHSDMLRDAPIDAVVAILPFALNAEVVEHCLRAGKHVITEKPQCNRSDRGRELAELARRQGLIYQVGYMKRFDPAIRWARERIARWRRSGAFGPMISLRIWCAHGAWQWFREPALSAGDDPAKYPSKLEPRWEWMDDAAWAEHQAWTNYYSHQTNLARYLAGADYGLEYAKRVAHDPAAGGGTSHFVFCRYDEAALPGAQLYLEFTGHTHNHWDEGFEVRFARATLRAKVPAPLAKRQVADVVAYEYPPQGEPHEYRPILPAIDGFAAQAQHFVACVRGEEEPLSPASEAVKEVEFSEAVMRLYQETGGCGSAKPQAGEGARR